MKIYIVTEGVYSGYGIEAVFSAREKAEEYVKIHDCNYRSYGIEEWDVDGGAEDESEKYYVCVYQDRTKKEYGAFVCDDVAIYAGTAVQTAPISGSIFQLGGDLHTRFTGTVSATSHEHALKIARDAMAKILAEEVGIV